MFNKLIHGVAYYPELWDDETIDNDIEQMKALEINTVRIGEFAWSTMEPDEDDFQMEFFIKILKKLHENGLSVILCTPTPTPPVWMTYNHPERLYWDGERTITYGARQHVCTNNPYFQGRVRKIVDKLARACGSLPGVIAWQVDNEFKCNVGYCCCAECERQWHAWLSDKYGTIDVLNQNWGTSIWSQRYQSFAQVPVPRRSTCSHNPSLTTNYRLFSKEKMTDFLKMQVDILRRYSDRPITHNSAVWFDVDYETMADHLDFLSFDDYPNMADYRQMIFDYDRYRGMKPGKPFMCMETSPGYNGDISFAPEVHEEGYVAAELAAAFALGACGFSYWHFHQHKEGCELSHGSILSSWGEPTSCYRQVQLAAQSLKKITPFLAGTVLKKAPVAIHYSDIGRAYMMTENYGEMDYIALVKRFYSAVLDGGYQRDVIPTGRKPDGYALVITPFLYHLDDRTIDDMLEFVSGGGTWLIGPMTNIRTKDHTVPTDAAIGRRLEKAAGIHIEFCTPTKGTDLAMSYKGRESKLQYWASVIRSRGARILAETTGGYLGGGGILSVNAYGKGSVMVLGGMPEDDAVLRALLADAAESSGVTERLLATDGIVGAIRVDGDGRERVLAVDLSGRGGTLAYKGSRIHVDPFDCGLLRVSVDAQASYGRDEWNVWDGSGQTWAQ